MMMQVMRNAQQRASGLVWMFAIFSKIKFPSWHQRCFCRLCRPMTSSFTISSCFQCSSPVAHTNSDNSSSSKSFFLDCCCCCCCFMNFFKFPPSSHQVRHPPTARSQALYFILFSFIAAGIFLLIWVPWHPLGYAASLDRLRGLTRPLWDKSPNFPVIILNKDPAGEWSINYIQAESLSNQSEILSRSEKFFHSNYHDYHGRENPRHEEFDAARCSSMNWTLNSVSPRRKLISFLLFNQEIDLMYLRLVAHMHVVDGFVILQSNYSFSGKSNHLYFAEALETWKRWNPSLDYSKIHLIDFVPPEEFVFGASTFEQAMANELLQRNYLWNSAKSRGLIALTDLALISDVDEITDPRALELLKFCTGWGTAIHLELETSLYSFEFPMQTKTEALYSNVMEYVQWSSYPGRFRRQSDYALGQAGWHCSFCLRTVQQIQHKIASYSHFDRAASRRPLDRTYIQNKICKGENLFDQVWEEWEWRAWARNSLFRGIEPRKGYRGIPRWVIQENERLRGQFNYLLPGFCVRP